MEITSPKTFFGFDAGQDGDMARWDKIVEYFYLLEKQSDRIKVVNMGETTEGNEFLQVIISSEDNINNIEEIKRMSRLISDPRGLDGAEKEELALKGKAVCVQSMSIHSHEIGGTQMSIKLAYDLSSQNTANILNILNEVVLVMVPCFNPDGEIKVTDWYYETKGTNYEGSEALPFIYHKYSGHDNNRDAAACNLVESKYMSKILFHEWKPQCYQDHHHMGSFGARMFVGFNKNPIDTNMSPLLLRETMQYGAHMACMLDKNGCKGIATGAIYSNFKGSNVHCENARLHNIVGFLTENATARLASPVHIYRDMLTGNANDVTEGYLPCIEMPRLWEGGKWGLSDIVKQMYFAALGLLDVMAKNKYDVLMNMMQKSLEQVRRGECDLHKAFAVRKEQYDKSALRDFINILRNQDIEMFETTEDEVVDNELFLKGTVVIPLAQPNYAAVKALLEHGDFPMNKFTAPGGVPVSCDCASENIADYMGIEIKAVKSGFAKNLIKLTATADGTCVKDGGTGYIISSKSNDAYKVVNKLINDGTNVYRYNEDFYTEADGICSAVRGAAVDITAVNCRPDGLNKIAVKKTGVYKTYWHGDVSEGWLRFVCDNYGFSYDDIRDCDILNGKLSEYDIFILPDRNYDGLYYGGPAPSAKMDDDVYDILPPPYKFGLGREGCRKIEEFVKNGGILITLNKAYELAVKELHIPVSNVLEGKDDFKACGSVLNAAVNKNHSITYGMPPETAVVHLDCPAFEIDDSFNHDRYSVILSYPYSNILKSGYLTGEKYIAGKYAIVEVKIGKGSVVLYGMQPHFRSQTHATFKLLFNAFYG